MSLYANFINYIMYSYSPDRWFHLFYYLIVCFCSIKSTAMTVSITALQLHRAIDYIWTCTICISTESEFIASFLHYKYII